MRYYRLRPWTAYEGSDLICLDGDRLPERLKMACWESQFQFVDKSLPPLPLTPDCGDVCPDFLLTGGVPLISDRLKRVFDRMDIRNLFYQRVRVQREDGYSESYFLAIPPRIDCLDRELSRLDADLEIAERIVIDPPKVGNYEIFKLAGIQDADIYVTETLCRAMEEAEITGAEFEPLAE